MGNSTSHSAKFVAEGQAHNGSGSSIRSVNWFEVFYISTYLSSTG